MKKISSILILSCMYINASASQNFDDNMPPKSTQFGAMGSNCILPNPYSKSIKQEARMENTNTAPPT